jgi:hypothetical protein
MFLRILWVLILCTGITLSAEEASFCFFLPPQGWEITDPTTLSPRVKIAFVKPKNQGFFPSMNLSVEKTSVSLSEYLKAVKAIHEQDRNNHWRALGKVHTATGLAQLTEIDTTSEWGPVRMLQLILLKEGHAYVLTAAALKKEFSKFYKEIQTAFRSLTLTTNLLSCIPLLEKQEGLKQKQESLFGVAKEEHFQEKYWPSFQQEVLTQFAEMGAYWQVLLLKQTQEELATRRLDPNPS